MKKTILLGLLSFAMASYTYAEDIYCPQQVSCEDDNLLSCRFSGGTTKTSIWNIQYEQYDHVKGSYSLTNVTDWNGKDINCLYRDNIDPHKTLLVYSNSGYARNTESPDQQWTTGSTSSYFSCTSSDSWNKINTYNCPIKKL